MSPIPFVEIQVQSPVDEIDGERTEFKPRTVLARRLLRHEMTELGAG
jgi:hypothetical protein